MKSIQNYAFGFVLLFAAAAASAQVKLGVMGGLNFAKLSVDPNPTDFDLSMKTAYGFGAVVDFGLSQSTSVQFEPQYLRKGAKAEDPGDNVVLSDIKANYLELPVMVKYSFGSGNLKPYLIGGPSFGILLSAKQEAFGIEEDIEDSLKNFDYGVALGGGVSYQTGKNTIFLQSRYGLGLANINDDPDDPDLNAKNRGLNIFMGVTFPVGGKS